MDNYKSPCGSEPWSYARAPSAFNYWTSSSAPNKQFLLIYVKPEIYIKCQLNIYLKNNTIWPGSGGTCL